MTEAGIVFSDEPFLKMFARKISPQKLRAGFQYKAFSDFEKVILLPCELINHNGDELKKCVEKFADVWDLGAEFVAWVNVSCTFLSTLVDRIVPGFPRDEIADLREKLGYQDSLVDAAEVFHLLVVGGANAEVQKKLPFSAANLNVIFTDDMYRIARAKRDFEWRTRVQFWVHIWRTRYCRRNAERFGVFAVSQKNDAR